MASRAEELDDFKTQIDLVQYAIGQGYEIDKRRTCNTSVALKNPTTLDRIIVGRGSNKHFFYASVHDHRDSGTIVDFCQNRGGGSLGEVRKTLRPWLGGSHKVVVPADLPPSPALEPAVVDLEQARKAFALTQPVEAGNAYLGDVRGIPVEVYTHPKFQGRVRVDRRGNLIFPHYDTGGLITGFEIKNDGFTGFAKGGVKRLFGSGIRANDRRLVIAESAIDMLSYAALYGVEDARFVSTGGALNVEQVNLLRTAMEKLAGGEILAAVDADEGGDVLYEQMEAVFSSCAYDGRTFRRHSPPTRGDDWNNVLKPQSGSVDLRGAHT